MRSIEERNALVIQYQGLAHKLARQLYNRSRLIRRLGEVQDAVSVAQLALLRSAERWQEGHASGANFMTYASRAIHRWLYMQAAAQGPIKLTPWILEQLHKDATQDTVLVARARACWDCESLRAERAERELSDGINETSPASDALEKAIRELNPPDRLLLARAYGIAGQAKETQAELAAERGLRPQAVNNRLAAIRRELRAALVQELDRDYEGQCRRVA